MTRLDVRLLIFLYVALLLMLGTVGVANKIGLVVAKATPPVGVEDVARPN